jgi:hypothetical protein
MPSIFSTQNIPIGNQQTIELTPNAHQHDIQLLPDALAPLIRRLLIDRVYTEDLHWLFFLMPRMRSLNTQWGTGGYGGLR